MAEEIINANGGFVLVPAKDIFDEMTIKCKNGHTFKSLANDIEFGQWCPECDEKDSIHQVLQSLNMEFEENVTVGKQEYKYVINGARRFVIFTVKDNRQKLISNAHDNQFNVIIVDDLENPMLKSTIWNAIKENTKFTLIEPERKVNDEVTCTEIRHLGNEKDDSGSIIKVAPEPHPENMLKCVGYIRVSTTMQVQDGFSLEAQEAKIYKESKNRNMFCKALYIDKGLSGGSTEKRLALQELRSNMGPNEWVVCSSVSRLARNTKDLLSILDEIEKLNSHLITLDLNLDLTTPAGKMVLTFFGSHAQFERELTSERVKTVMSHLKDRGLLRTKPLFGWKMNLNRGEDEPIHVRDEDEQEIIRRIRNLRNLHKQTKITEFTRIVNESKLPPPRKSKQWYHKSLSDLMKREGIK